MRMILCRNWLPEIAAEYAEGVGLADRATNDCIKTAAREADNLMRLMPWHARFAVGCVEIAASVFCLLDLLLHAGASDAERAMRNFAKVPVVSAPLFRLYRSVVAVAFFEQDPVLNVLGVENPDKRQDRFRYIRQQEKAA